MSPAVDILSLVAVAAVVAGLCRRYGLSEPLALTVIGIGLSYVPNVLEIKLTPDIVLIGLLPPLLYSAAIRTSLVDFRTNRRSILLLSIGLVAFTTVGVGLIAWWVVPGLTLAAGFAIGAVVAPPDAVAATTVARRVGMPRGLVSVLEGESLLNDATALVALNTAIAALSTSVSPWHVGWDFVREAGGGIGVGLVAAFVLALVRKQINDPVLDTTLSFAAPYVAFLPAQQIHASGVLAVVITGLLLGHRSPTLQSASSRIAENINWRTVQFVLENAVFLLIGLQIKRIVKGVEATDLTWTQVVFPCAAILAGTMVLRVVWTMTVVGLLKAFGIELRPWRGAAVIAWAGMRGVVTLAAVFLLPSRTPERALLQLAAFTVVAGTLLIQGLTLPWLVRRLGLPSPNAAEDALQRAGLLNAAGDAGLAALNDLDTDGVEPGILEQLRNRATVRSNRAWEELGRAHSELEPPAAVYRRLRLHMLSAERGSVLEARDRGVYDDEVLRGALSMIDMEESLLDRVEDATANIGAELATAQQRAGDCEHLRAAPPVITPLTPNGCEECLRDGTTWVHLRLCLTCGHVGCCDSSVHKHAAAHFRETGHPVMRSFEPGEAWRWCYVDDLLA